MDSLLFALNAVLPIVLTVAVGYCLKKIGLIDQSLAKACNRLVFRVFLPVMLFLNVYKIEDIGGLKIDYIVYVVIAVLITIAFSVPFVLVLTKDSRRRGALLQATFRSNYALIGIPLAQSLFGQQGVIVATLLSAAVIPLYNVLAVFCLSVFGNGGEKPRLSKILKDIVTNPLILSILAGLVALGIRAVSERAGMEFRLSNIVPVYKVLGYLSDLATPLALLVLGAQFEFSAVRELRKEIIFGTLMRTVFVPVLGLGGAYLLFSDRFSGAHFAAFVAVFATPVAVSSVPMAQEMDSDVVLAGQLVVWTTLFSALSVFITSFLLRAAGIFS